MLVLRYRLLCRHICMFTIRSQYDRETLSPIFGIPITIVYSRNEMFFLFSFNRCVRALCVGTFKLNGKEIPLIFGTIWMKVIFYTEFSSHCVTTSPTLTNDKIESRVNKNKNRISTNFFYVTTWESFSDHLCDEGGENCSHCDTLKVIWMINEISNLPFVHDRECECENWCCVYILKAKIGTSKMLRHRMSLPCAIWNKFSSLIFTLVHYGILPTIDNHLFYTRTMQYPQEDDNY